MPQKPIDGQAILIQIMACCHKDRSQYLSQGWPRSMMCVCMLISIIVSVFGQNPVVVFLLFTTRSTVVDVGNLMSNIAANSKSLMTK